jgi:anti-anti-sigma factor
MTGYQGSNGEARDAEPALTVRVTNCNDGVVVHVRGEVDLATRGLFEARLAAACAGDADIWLDLTDVAFLDPQGARFLGRLQAAHPGLRLGSLSDAARRTIEIVDAVDGAAAGGITSEDDGGLDVAPA